MLQPRKRGIAAVSSCSIYDTSARSAVLLLLPIALFFVTATDLHGPIQLHLGSGAGHAFNVRMARSKSIPLKPAAPAVAQVL